jgi:uncharacterized membrane-anchored protein YitT (DUF2179 family)
MYIHSIRKEVRVMGGKKNIGTVLIIVGIVVLFVSVAADAIGVGHAPGIGHNQILGAVIGAMLAGLGSGLRKK